MFKRFRTIPEYKRYNTILTFKLIDGTIITDIQHELPLDVLLKKLTVTIGYRDYYHINYPTCSTAGRPGDFPDNVEGTPAIELMLPVAEVKRVWLQRKALA